MGITILLEETAGFLRKQKGLRIVILLLVGAVVVICAQGCNEKESNKDGITKSARAQSTGPCGKFDCLNSKALPENLGAEYKVQFKFQPADCGNNCRCGKIAYVQIARVVLHDGTQYDDGYHTPLMVRGIKTANGEESPELNGWFIDAWLDSKYGYYGRDSDGQFSAEIIKLGQNEIMPEVPAWLFDRPTGIPKDSLVEFVDIPVCLDPNASCKNKLLGYSHWWFIVKNDGSPPSIEGPSPNLNPTDERLNVLKNVVKLAMTQWNESAASRGFEIELFPEDMIATR